MEIGEDFTQDHFSSGLDISQLCRICANPNDYLIPIFEGEGREHELKSKITKHLPIKVLESDKLPTQLCYQCASTIIAWHDLVVACIDAEKKFNSLFKEDGQSIVEIKAETIKGTFNSHYDTKTERGGVTEQRDINLEDPTEVLTENILIGSPEDHEKIMIEEVKTMVSESIEEVPSESRWEEDIIENRDSQMIETASNRESDELASDIESDEEFDTVYSCSFCKASNMTRVEFIAHSRIHTKIEKRSASIKTSVVDKETEELAARRAAAAKGFKIQLAAGCSVTLYICTICGQGNLLLKDLESHSNAHPQRTDSHYCHMCLQQFEDNDKLDSHLGIHLDNIDLFCQFCNKSFTTIKDLELHEITHLQEEFVCTECRRRFKTKDSVLVHFKKSHLIDSRCEICKFEFKTNNLINEHFMSHTFVSVINKTVNYFKCVYCQKQYGSKISLQRHVLFVHKNRMPYICEKCGFTAYHEETLRKHVAVEHQNVEKLKNKEIKCEPETNEVGISDNTKDGSSHYNKTVEISNVENKLNEEHCNFCNEAFENHETLNIHVNKVHSNKSTTSVITILPFLCQICNAQFKLEFELEEHNELHNVTYQCHFCYKEFVTDTSLQEHLKESHDEQMESADILELISSSDEGATVESEILGL